MQKIEETLVRSLSGRSPGERNGSWLQCSCWENPTDRRTSQAMTHWGHKELDTSKATEHYCTELDGPSQMTQWWRICPPIQETDSTPESERSPGEENGNPLQCSCLEKSMGRDHWQATVRGVTKSWTWLRLRTNSRLNEVIWMVPQSSRIIAF